MYMKLEANLSFSSVGGAGILVAEDPNAKKEGKITLLEGLKGISL
jgi:hypothetical protein